MTGTNVSDGAIIASYDDDRLGDTDELIKTLSFRKADVWLVKHKRYEEGKEVQCEYFLELPEDLYYALKATAKRHAQASVCASKGAVNGLSVAFHGIV